MQARFVGLHLFALDFLFCPYNLPRKKVRTIRFSTAPSIDSNCSKATSSKFDIHRIRRRVVETRKVTIEWNARRKLWFLPEFRRRKHRTRPQALFSPISFLLREKRYGRRRQPAVANLLQPLRRVVYASIGTPAPLKGEPFITGRSPPR